MNISACIICCNESTRIKTALDSLAWCTDIVVVDSGSTDDTMDVARNHPSKPRVLHHDWAGFNGQRKFAAEQCENPWVLMLDADEECSGDLAREVQALSDDGTVGMYVMPRHNYVGQKYMRCWSPDYQQRLIHRDRVAWDDAAIPEARYATAGFIEKKLRAPLLHGRLDPLSFRDVADGRRMEMYALNLSETMHKRGKPANFINLLLRPAMAFFKYYILKGGFLDGTLGLIVCYRTTIGVMLKYSALYVREQTTDGKEKG